MMHDNTERSIEAMIRMIERRKKDFGTPGHIKACPSFVLSCTKMGGPLDHALSELHDGHSSMTEKSTR